MGRKLLVIAVDFDGTVVKHAYPEIGEDIGAGRVLRKIIDTGHKIILNTMRSGDQLDDAVNWFKNQGIELYGVNKNPTQHEWTDSPKVFANLYIDDYGLNIPLCYDHEGNRYVDWMRVENILVSTSVIPEYNTKKQFEREKEINASRRSKENK